MKTTVKHPTLALSPREFATKEEAQPWIAMGWVEVKTRKTKKSTTANDESADSTNKE